MTQYSGKVIRKTPVTPTQQSASGVWTTEDAAVAVRNNTWPVPGVPDPISRSVRLRTSASAYFTRTPAVAGNRRTWTWSGWVKCGTISPRVALFGFGTSASSGSPGGTCYFESNTIYVVSGGGTATYVSTTPVYRDPSAWYHIVIAFDSTQATSSNRVKIYVNGSQVTALANTTYPSQNYDSDYNYTTPQYLGVRGDGGLDSYFDGYITEVNSIDGQALTPSSFGTTDAATGAWIPMPYTGTYGTNGFYLNFKDNTSTTTLGYDYSGNSNNWTATNVSLTAGYTYDSMLDVPTPWVGYNTGDTTAVTRGNYATFNPLTGGSSTTSDGNLAATFAPINGARVSTIAVTSGKWYAEFVYTSIVGYAVIGIGAPYSKGWTTTQESNANCVVKYSHTNGGTAVGSWTMPTSSLNFTYTTGNVIGIALDMTTNTVTFYKDGVNVGNFTFTVGAGGSPSDVCFLMGNSDASSNGAGYANFGQRPFTYTPPSGYKALCTTNLPTPTITNGANYMAASTYTGTGSTRSVVNSGNNTAAISFQPDLVWVKSRNNANSSQLTDSVRGNTLALASDLTIAEYTGEITINSTGYSASGGAGATNLSGWTYVAWQWQAGAGTTASNTSGSITSTVSVNQTAGFSIVTYTGTGANATVGHGLGVAPQFFVVKPRSTTGSWIVYATALGSPNLYTVLNATADPYSAAPTVWNSTAPTSSVFSIGTASGVNTSTTTYVAYCWAAVAGYSAFGSYTGNGSSDGPFVYLGFRPRYLWIKRTNSTGNWIDLDTSRSTYNSADAYLSLNASSAEATGAYNTDILSNGFKLRYADPYGDVNASGSTYIYAAFAENPFKYSNAR